MSGVTCGACKAQFSLGDSHDCPRSAEATAARVDRLETEVRELRAALAQALALVQRSGFNWKEALRLVERWVRPGAAHAAQPGQLPASPHQAPVAGFRGPAR